MDSTHCINSATPCSGCDDVDHINVTLLNRLQRHIKICINFMQTKTRFPAQFMSPQSLQSTSRDSSVGIEAGYGLHDRGVGVRVLLVNNFLFSTSSRPALGPSQPHIQWVPGALSRGERGRSVKLTSRLKLVPRSRKYGSIHALPHTLSWRIA
jgi:hypothetical protein